MGHATRCVPIIYSLLKNGNKVILGVTPLTSKILELEFPQLQKINISPYNISYSSVLPIWLKFLIHLPRFRAVIKKEHRELSQIVSGNNIDVIISDNRYGLYHSNTINIVICHQINLITPFFTSIANSIHKKWLNKFTEIWVPDFQDRSKSLAGALSSNKLNLNCNYIGPLSRLSIIKVDEKYDYLFLLSGPDPQHTVLLNKVIALAKKSTSKKVAIVTSKKIEHKDDVDVFYLPDTKKLSELIASSKQVICRSGYSTLMDLHLFGKTDLILIPTKGQTEQEYLAQHWKTHFNALILNENKLNEFKL